MYVELLNNQIGIITGTFGTEQFPIIPCRQVNLKARSDNDGSFFLGFASGTVALPWELNAGEETGWFELDNLGKMWHNRSSGSADYLAYHIQW